MVGHKCNLMLLLQDLKTENILHTHTEFCQGRTTRWGLAWTYNNSYNLHKLVPPRDKIRKRNTPLSYVLPELPDNTYNLEKVFHKIKSILIDLNIKNTTVFKKMQKIEIHISALENTWSNQRRKRRLMERIKELDKKKAKICKGDEEPLLNSTIIDTNMDSDKNVTDNDTKEENNAASLHKKHREGQSSFNIMNADTKSENETSMLQNIKKKPSSMSDVDAIESENNTTNLHNKRKRTSCNIRCSKTSCSVNGIEEQSSTTDENSILNLGTAIHNNNQIEQPSFQAAKADVDVQSMYEPTQPIVQGIIKLIKANSVIILELEYLTGSGGKESIHQILQYIKNNWK